MTTVDETQLRDKLGKGKPLVVDFYADWCAPCRAISPILDDLSKTRDDVEFVKIDVDANPGITDELKVMAMPTVVYFSANGEELGRSVGAVPAAVLTKRLGLDSN